MAPTQVVAIKRDPEGYVKSEFHEDESLLGNAEEQELKVEEPWNSAGIKEEVVSDEEEQSETAGKEEEEEEEDWEPQPKKSRVRKRKKEKPAAAPSKESKLPLEWNRCTFTCDMCGYSKRSYDLFSRHRNSEHKDAPVPLRGNIAAFASALKFHPCKICGKPLLHDLTLIRNHVFHQHRVGLTDYVPTPQRFREKSVRVMGVELKVPRLVEVGAAWAESKREEDLKASLPSFTLKQWKSLKMEDIRPDMTTTEVVDLCRMECSHCGEEFSRFTNLRKHLASNYNARERDYSNNCFTEIRIHSCKLCSKKILCDKSSISQHVRQCHKIRFEKYISFKGTKRPPYPLKKTVAPAPPRRATTKKHKAEPDSKSLTLRVANLCSFRCDRCSFETTSFRILKSHVSRAHRQRIHYDVRFVSEARYHKCSICGSDVLSDRNIIGKHLWRSHRVSLETYTKSLDSGVPIEAKTLKDEEEERRVEAKELRAQVPVLKSLKKINPANSIPERETTRAFRNLCTFRCPGENCGWFQSHSSRVLHRHLTKCQRGSQGFDMRHVAEARYHSCAVCSEKVLCDRGLILKHTLGRHGVRTEEYEKLCQEAVKTEESAQKRRRID